MAGHGVSPERGGRGGGGIWVECRFKLADSNFFSGLTKTLASYAVPKKEEHEEEEFG
jgi:hypothetical protein